MNSTQTPQKKVIPISVAIVIFEDCVLVGKRAESSHLGGMYEFPGGKQESNETAEACAIRECAEETGLQVVNNELLHHEVFDYGDRSVDLRFFLCYPVSDELTSDVLESFRWVKIQELETLNFPEGNDRVLQKLRGHFL